MSRSNVTATEALRRLVAEVKLLDANEVGERWNQFNGAIAVAEMVLRDYVEPEPYGWLTGDSTSHRQGSLYDLAGTYEFAKATCDETNRWERAQLDCDPDYVDRVPEPLYAVPVAAQPAAAPASVPELSHAQQAAIWNALPGRFMADFGYQQFAEGIFEKQRELLAAAPLHESGSAAAPEYRNDPSVQGMADCMDMVRGELIEAGIVDAKTAPMFLVEAVCRHIAALNREILELKRVYDERGNQIARLDIAVERCNIAAAPAIAAPTEVERIIPDWPFCNPGCDYEDPHGGMHDNRGKDCCCDEAKASICRQRAAIATGEKAK